MIRCRVCRATVAEWGHNGFKKVLQPYITDAGKVYCRPCWRSR